MQLPDVVDLIQRALAEHAWDLAGVLVGIATAVLVGLEYRESRRSRERALVLEVLSNVVLPLLNHIERLAREPRPDTRLGLTLTGTPRMRLPAGSLPKGASISSWGGSEGAGSTQS